MALKGITAVNRGIILAHYFKGRLRGKRLSAAEETRAGHAEPRHICQAPYLGVGVTEAARQTFASHGQPTWHSEEEERRQPLLLFFAGNIDAPPPYSEGVRQALAAAHANSPGFKIVRQSATYITDFQSAAFCAAPLGEGWGIRLIWAVAYGCIPLLFRSSVRHFWDDVLPYETFSLTVDPKDIPQLPRILGGVSAARRRALRDGLARYHRYFLWEPPYGLAYNLTLAQLCARAAKARLAASRGTRAGALRCPDPLAP